ncbi:hypothetical protein VTK56DRAFT_3960 [Thermocarpiscus australiensis]
MASPTETDNRTRVRDNQRRSRARRKEYLQELEQRVRQAELHRVQASVEVQAAARKVAEENRKLRFLLRQHGVSDSSIEEFLRSGSGMQMETSRPSTVMPGIAVQRLEEVLDPRTSAMQLGQENAHSCTVSNPMSPETAPASQTSSAASRDPSPDKSNCSMATDLISAMTGADPCEVRTSLGCAPGMECQVDNTVVSDTIDRLIAT